MKHIIKEELIKLGEGIIVIFVEESETLTEIKLPSLNIVSEFFLESKESILRFCREYSLIQYLKANNF